MYPGWILFVVNELDLILAEVNYASTFSLKHFFKTYVCGPGFRYFRTVNKSGMVGAKRDVAELPGEEEPRSIRERLRRKEIEKERINREGGPHIKKPRDREWER